MTGTVREDITGLAREVFGYARLRPGQAEAVEGLLDGRDVLVVMPTGGGKSAIYQLAAMLRRTRSGVDKLRVRDPHFPKPLKDGDDRRSRIYFVRSEIEAYLAARLEARGEAD